mmetsp:Transcript_26432/g.41309  ORF Transcript_26432/g.41309 Transcript_26432/m.41309 type:complete len:206 (+) Transcript_26432:1579-2196(+)
MGYKLYLISSHFSKSPSFAGRINKSSTAVSFMFALSPKFLDPGIAGTAGEKVQRHALPVTTLERPPSLRPGPRSRKQPQDVPRLQERKSGQQGLCLRLRGWLRLRSRSLGGAKPRAIGIWLQAAEIWQRSISLPDILKTCKQIRVLIALHAARRDLLRSFARISWTCLSGPTPEGRPRRLLLCTKGMEELEQQQKLGTSPESKRR